MGLEVAGRGHGVGRSDHPAHPPAGHGIGLGHTVEHDAAILQFGNHHRHGMMLGLAVCEVLVDLVGEDPDAVLRSPAADLLDLRAGVDGAGRVGRRHEDQRLGPGGSGRLQLVDAHPEAARGGGQNGHGHAAGQGDRLGIGRPVGGGQQHLVARVDHRGDGVVHRVLAAVGDQHVGRVHLQARVAPGLGRHRLTEILQTADGGVLVVLGIAARGRGRLHDVGRGGEVGLARAEADDPLPRGPQRPGLGRDRQGGRGGDRPDPP